MNRALQNLAKLTFVLVGLALARAPAAAQSTAPDTQSNQKPSNVSGSAPSVAEIKQPSSQVVAQQSYLTPISGYQGVLAETLDGATIAAQAVDDKFNPASSVKLATTLVALQALGPDHKFVTGIWIAGSLDRSTGTLTGDLVLTGRDPSLHFEHAVMLARELNQLGIRSVTGNLIITPSFTMNFDWSAKHSGEMFRDALDAAKRPASATRAWLDDRTLVGDNTSLSNVPSVVINGEVQIGAAPPGAVPMLTHKSSKLIDVLKALLCYSNNFMAERIGDGLGGPEAISALLTKNLGLNPDELSLASASGVGVNRVTPRAMMKVLRALRDELAKHKLSLSDILPVAGVDPGTLEDRYTDPRERGSVVAKTGTLIRTDGGASSLVGQLKTRSGRVVLFVIMNQRGNVVRFRQNQDTIVTSIQNSLGGPAAFDYHPVKLAMRLANSEFEAAKGRGEYEPKN